MCVQCVVMCRSQDSLHEPVQQAASLETVSSTIDDSSCRNKHRTVSGVCARLPQYQPHASMPMESPDIMREYEYDFNAGPQRSRYRFEAGRSGRGAAASSPRATKSRFFRSTMPKMQTQQTRQDCCYSNLHRGRNSDTHRASGRRVASLATT